MNALTVWEPTDTELADLTRRVEGSPEIIPFSDDPAFAGAVAAIGMGREVGTYNDELARFLFDQRSGAAIDRAALGSELVRYGSKIGVRIRAKGVQSIDIQFRGIQELLHPTLSFDVDGKLQQLVIFPASVARILEQRGVNAVLVRPWALNTIFGRFDPKMHFYETNMWELTNVDTSLFARLISQRQIPFLGTHDFVAHIAATDGTRWTRLQERGREVLAVMEEYLQNAPTPSLASLVLPYLAGVLLDDLAQPVTYDDETRSVPLRVILDHLQRKSIDPNARGLLTHFPPHFAHLIELARFQDLKEVQRSAEQFVQHLVDELKRATIALPAPARSS